MNFEFRFRVLISSFRKSGSGKTLVLAVQEHVESSQKSEEENLLKVFMERSYSSEMEAFIAEAEYSYIQEADKRAFYMAIELWKKEAGPARQGHKDFLPMAIKMIPQLGLSKAGMQKKRIFHLRLRFRFSRNAILRLHFRLRFPKTLETRNANSFFVSK